MFVGKAKIMLKERHNTRVTFLHECSSMYYRALEIELWQVYVYDLITGWVKTTRISS